MAKIHFVLRKKNDKYFFSNPKRDTENELFDCKIDGIEIIVELLADEIISEDEATELLTSVLSIWDIPYGKVTPLAQFESDALAIHKIESFRTKLHFVNELQKIPNLPKFRVCPGCGKHGKVLGKKFISMDFYSQETAIGSLDELIGNGSINREEEVKLKKEISESSLPVKGSTQNPALN